jgi:hypothetical protein
MGSPNRPGMRGDLGSTHQYTDNTPTADLGASPGTAVTLLGAVTLAPALALRVMRVMRIRRGMRWLTAEWGGRDS